MPQHSASDHSRGQMVSRVVARQRSDLAEQYRMRKKSAPVAAERIARLADEGEDVSRFFTNRDRTMGRFRG